MAYISPEYLKTLQTRSEYKFFKVLDSSGKLTINSLDTDIGIDAAADLLQETLENIQADYVIVKLYQNKPERVDTSTTSQLKVLTLKVKLDTPGNSSIGSPSKQNFNLPGNSVSLNTHLDLINENQNLKFEVHKLKLEIEAAANLEEETTEKPSLLDHPLVSSIAGLLIKKFQEPAPIIGASAENQEFQEAINTIANFEQGKKTLLIIAGLGPETWKTMILPPLKEKLSVFYEN
jgi:hypothetical protein